MPSFPVFKCDELAVEPPEKRRALEGPFAVCLISIANASLITVGLEALLSKRGMLDWSFLTSVEIGFASLCSRGTFLDTDAVRDVSSSLPCSPPVGFVSSIFAVSSEGKLPGPFSISLEIEVVGFLQSVRISFGNSRAGEDFSECEALSAADNLTEACVLSFEPAVVGAFVLRGWNL